MVGFGFQELFCIISAIGCTYLTNTRTYFMAFNTVMSLIGTIMIRQIDHKYIWGRFMGYCLTIVFSVNFPLLLATITSNIAGFSKKVTATAIVSYRGYPFPMEYSRILINRFNIGVYCILHREHHRASNHVLSGSTKLSFWICGDFGLLFMFHHSYFRVSLLPHVGKQEARCRRGRAVPNHSD